MKDMTMEHGEHQSVFAETFAAEAHDALRELNVALTAVGISLPHLSVDPDRHSESPRQLIDLGPVRPHIACMLAALIRKGGAPTFIPPPPHCPTLTELTRRAEDLAQQIHHHLEREHQSATHSHPHREREGQ